MKTGDVIKEFTMEGNKKLDKQYSSTRIAISHIALETVSKFMGMGDVGLGEDERKILQMFISDSMIRSFSLGYGIGKAEGITGEKIYL